MSIPVNAKVRAVPHFLHCLRAARAFMDEQEIGPTAAMPFIKLEDDLALETASRYKHEYLGGVIYSHPG